MFANRYKRSLQIYNLILSKNSEKLLIIQILSLQFLLDTFN